MKRFDVVVKQINTYEKAVYAESQTKAIEQVKRLIEDNKLNPTGIRDVVRNAEEKPPRYVVNVKLEGMLETPVAWFDDEADAQAFANLKNEMEGL